MSSGTGRSMRTGRRVVVGVLVAMSSTIVVGCGNPRLDSVRAIDPGCDGQHPATVDAVVVASSDPSTPVGTTRRAVWTVTCYDDEDPSLEGAWPPDLDQVSTSLTRAARTISCPTGSRSSLFEATSVEPDRRVFAAGTSSVGWFVTDVRADECDLDDGVRWEFEAEISSREGADGSPGYLAAGRLEGQAVPRDGEAPFGLELTWDACTDFCLARLRLQRPAPPGGFPESLTAGTPLFGSFDPTAPSADFVLYVDCDGGEETASGRQESQARRRVAVSATDLSSLQAAEQLVVEAPKGSLQQVTIDGRCSESERALDARLGVELLVVSVTSREGAAVPATTSTAPPPPDVRIDIPVTGSTDRSLAADLDVDAAERARLLDRDEFALQYALAEWGPFVAYGLLWVIVGLVLWRRRGVYPSQADPRDRIDLVRESCELAAQRSREQRRLLRVSGRLFWVVVGGVAAVAIPAVLLGRSSRWSDIAVPRLIVANLVTTFAFLLVVVMGPSLRRQRMARRMTTCEQQLRYANGHVDQAELVRVVVATIDALPSDDLEVSQTVRGEVTSSAVDDDFDAAVVTAIELTRQLVGRSTLTRPPGLEPRTLAAIRYLDEVAPAAPATAVSADESEDDVAERPVATSRAGSSDRRRTRPPAPSRAQAPLTIGSVAGAREIRSAIVITVVFGVLGAIAILLAVGGDLTIGTRIRGLVVGGILVASVLSLLGSLRSTSRSTPLDVELRLVASTPNRRWYRIEGDAADRCLGISSREELPPEFRARLQTGPGPRHLTLSIDGRVIVAPSRARPPSNATPVG